MKGLERKPLAEVRAYLADSIQTLQRVGSTEMLHLALSMNEYLKDAERWQVVKNQEVVFYPGILPDDVERIVDKYIQDRS